MKIELMKDRHKLILAFFWNNIRGLMAMYGNGFHCMFIIWRVDDPKDAEYLASGKVNAAIEAMNRCKEKIDNNDDWAEYNFLTKEDGEQ